MARKFVLGLRHTDFAATVLVASRSRSNAERFAAEMSVGVAAASYREAIATSGVDAFYVATPPSEHKALALACIAAGRPVLIEKPFAMNALEAEEIVAEARTASVFCMEGMWTRFLPLARRLKAVVVAGDVGEIRLITGSFGAATSPQASPNLYSKDLGGGALLHRGVYPLSIASYLLGQPTAVVSKAAIGPTGVDEDCAVMAVHAGGGMSLTHSSLRVQAANDLTIMGTSGTIHVRAPVYRPFQMTVVDVAAQTGRREAGGRIERLKEGDFLQGANQRLAGLSDAIRGGKSRSVRAFYRGNGYHYEAEEVMRCVREGVAESDVMPLADTLAIIEAMDQARAQWG